MLYCYIVLCYFEMSFEKFLQSPCTYGESLQSEISFLDTLVFLTYVLMRLVNFGLQSKFLPNNSSHDVLFMYNLIILMVLDYLEEDDFCLY